MAGRPRKPTGAKILQGTWRADRANPDEPEIEPIEGTPAPPRKLKGEAKREWGRVVGYVIKNRIAGAEGLSVLATYCNLHAYVVSQEKHGNVLPGSILAQYRALAGEFGLTGSSRAKLHKPKAKQTLEDPWQALANSK